MNPTDWFALSLKRMQRAAYVIAALGFLTVLIATGWRNALGFLAGAIIAHFNFSLWKRITNSIGESSETAQSDSKAIILGLRYLLIAGAVFVIIKILEVSVLAVVAGLLVSAAAALVELVRQLVRPDHGI